MSAKKNSKFLISAEEQKKFQEWLKERKITYKKLGDIICMSENGVGDAFADNRVVRLWPEHLKLHELCQEQAKVIEKFKSFQTEIKELKK